MPVQENDVHSLQAAFQQFNATSNELEKNYSLLSKEVHLLRVQLSKSREETEVLREEAERNHRLSAVGEMASRMAHELRNPLGSIELFASLIEKELKKQKLSAEKLAWSGHLKSAVRSMDHVIDNLLRFTGSPQPRFEHIEAGALIQSVMPFVSSLMKQHQITLQQDKSVEPIWIVCDPDLMRQVLINLILNSIEAMDTGGTLTISTLHTHPSDPWVTITVSDTGCGLTDQTLEKLFDPFFTTKKQGTGLGLAIAQNSVNAHGGRLRAHNLDHGGACFTLDLPSQREEDTCQT